MLDKIFSRLRQVGAMWFILPYVAASAFSTMPTVAGFVALAIEWAVFGTVFVAWRRK